MTDQQMRANSEGRRNQKALLMLVLFLLFIIALSVSLIVLFTSYFGAANPARAAGSSGAAGSLGFYFPEEPVRSAFPDTITPPADAAMKTDAETYPADTTLIGFTIENPSGRDRITDAAYTLEYWRDQAWYAVPYVKLRDKVVRAWPAVAYRIPAEGSWSDTVSLSEHTGLTAGRYRLIKEISALDRSDSFRAYISAEFQLH